LAKINPPPVEGDKTFSVSRNKINLAFDGLLHPPLQRLLGAFKSVSICNLVPSLSITLLSLLKLSQ
jgi:hypothetical protein